MDGLSASRSLRSMPDECPLRMEAQSLRAAPARTARPASSPPHMWLRRLFVIGGAIAGQRRFDVLRCKFRNQIGRNRRRVAKRLIEMPYELRNQPHRIGQHDHFVMFGAVFFGERRRVLDIGDVSFDTAGGAAFDFSLHGVSQPRRIMHTVDAALRRRAVSRA